MCAPFHRICDSSSPNARADRSYFPLIVLSGKNGDDDDDDDTDDDDNDALNDKAAASIPYHAMYVR